MYTTEFEPEQYVQTRITTDEPQKEDFKSCPFMRGVDSKCSEECAMHTLEGCGLVTGKSKADGGMCPFRGVNTIQKCSEACIFFDEGCMMIKRARKSK